MRKTHKAAESAFMAALAHDDETSVRRVLDRDVGAAKERFAETLFEPPLCFAIRSRCSRPVLKQLLRHGADPNDQDVCGKSALMLLCQAWKARGWHGPVPTFLQTSVPVPTATNESAVIKVALLLLSHGAEPEQDNGRGKNAIGVAEDAGAARLVSVLRNYKDVQAYLTLSRVGSCRHSRRGPFLAGLPTDLVRQICSFLVPRDLEPAVRRVSDSLSLASTRGD